MRRTDQELPFAVSPDLSAGLAGQIVRGVSNAIESGRYASGDTLPGIRRMAKSLRVSEITVRSAVKELCRNGLLQARPRVGLTVCAGGSRAWRGVVCGLHSEPLASNYYANVLEDAIAAELAKRGWLFARTVLPVAGRKTLEAVLDIVRRTFAPSLFIAPFAPAPLASALSGAGIPHVRIWTRKRSCGAVLSVVPCADSAVARLAADLKASGAKRIVAVRHNIWSLDLESALRMAGLSVKTVSIRPLPGYRQPEGVQRAALRHFDRLLSRGPVAADAMVFNDDYLAAGALTAFDRHCVRIPEDMRFATMSNRGHGPVHVRPLTCIEMDPWRHGREVAARVLRLLDGEKIEPVITLEPSYIKGESV